ncbi:hypothetical protein [Roseateles puraquae]|uniref:hypothetical protein n=1 Tax=Roseateles puraquae TaxID=431059 RepID=UPI0031D39C28
MAADAPPALPARRLWRMAAKVLHELASIGFGGGLAACLFINGLGDRGTPETFATAREAFAAIANYLLVPSMAVVVVSGLLAIAATRGYMDAGWAWLKALLGITVFEATLMVVGSGGRHAEMLAAFTADPVALQALLRSERNTLWLLIALSAINVVLAVWRPRLTWRVR